MKEQLHTIPISDAMANAGECPFCYIEQKTEEHAMNYVLGHGASYMEADIRDMTDREGFCRSHFKKMYDYGNSLGNAWILKTLTLRHMNEMQKEFKNFKPDSVSKKGGIFSKKTSDESTNSIVNWIIQRESSCFICTTVNNTFDAYMKTFFSMYKKDSEFRNQLAQTKGFCLSHFKVLCQGADQSLNEKERKEFYDMVLPLMEDNLSRIYEDVAWFIEKYDYKNKDADWKNSKDAIQRTMQKLRGGDPSRPPFQLKK